MTSGAYRLSDFPPDERVVVLCHPCGRRGSFARDALMARHGDLALPDLLRVIVAGRCPVTGRDQACGAVYERTPGTGR